MICVISLAMLFSTFTNSSLTAAIGTLVVVIVMQILGAFSYFDFLKPYLFTSHLDAWQNLFQRVDRLGSDREGRARLRRLHRRVHRGGLVRVPPQGRPRVEEITPSGRHLPSPMRGQAPQRAVTFT